MGKKADRYYEINEWIIRENGFNSEYGEVSESVFSLGNEYMGIRGYFEEDYSGSKLIGSYFNGVYEKIVHGGSGYLGIVNSTEYMVNSVNWLYTRIEIDGEKLDLANSTFQDFYREIDLKTGILTRGFLWKTKSGKRLEVEFERFLSMNDVEFGVQKITLRSIDFDGDIDIMIGLDLSAIHKSMNENMWLGIDRSIKEKRMSILGKTVNTGKHVYSTCRMFGEVVKKQEINTEKLVANEYSLSITKGQKKSITKLVGNYVISDGIAKDVENIRKACKEAEETLDYKTYEQLKEDTMAWWSNVWKTSDITIDGDPLNQQGIRFCIFQMFQTYQGAIEGTNIGAKGLTGEAYNGNTFWDTETYCLPFYIFNHQEAAKNLLMYRYHTLDAAKERAKQLDCEGAFYPIATISGSECCNLWQHASLQLQASTGVAYGIWFYEKLTKDTDFLFHYGVEMLTEISRMLISRGDYNSDGTKFGYYCVMGPDEFQMMVNHNCYTNYMGRFTLDYALKVWDRLEKEAPVIYDQFVRKLNVTKTERKTWRTVASDMYIPYEDSHMIFEQHDGFFKLPHVDVDQIPIEEFPLYHHWTYDRIYRNDMIKQPDVLMFLFLFNSTFTLDQIKANYEFYEPKCIHESSLSPSVHSILASQLKKHEEAYEFFQFATRMDLDNYNRNSKEGLHTTSIAAAWMNIIYGFGGMRSDGDQLQLNPSIPKNWESYSFRIASQGDVILVRVDQESVALCSQHGTQLVVSVYESTYLISEKETRIIIPKEWLNASRTVAN